MRQKSLIHYNLQDRRTCALMSCAWGAICCACAGQTHVVSAKHSHILSRQKSHNIVTAEQTNAEWCLVIIRLSPSEFASDMRNRRVHGAVATFSHEPLTFLYLPTLCKAFCANVPNYKLPGTIKDKLVWLSTIIYDWKCSS